jgi:hypothetical protein
MRLSAVSAGFLVNAEMKHVESMIDLALAAAISQSSDVCLYRLDDPRPNLSDFPLGVISSGDLWAPCGAC